MSTLVFRLTTSGPTSHAPVKFAPRLGLLTFTRADVDGTIEMPTPGVLGCTIRGVIPHLSRDNLRRTTCLQWVHVPFESFLQTDPPVPTLQGGVHSLHTFLGFSPATTIVSMSLRDPADAREMPPNGKLFVTAQSARGTRKVMYPAYRAYVDATQPDIVIPLSDVPFTPPPHSQKRISKSIERSIQWLVSILAPHPRPTVFLHMVGGIKPAARAAFAAALQEPLEQKERELLAPLETLDEGVAGYVFDLVPLRSALLAENTSPPVTPMELIRASLETLPTTKPRLVTTPNSPHEMLTLIRDASVDLFDTAWAQRAADWGFALDFSFPAPSSASQRDVGHNLYDARYAHDFAELAESCGMCPCMACAPTWTDLPLAHSAADRVEQQPPSHHAAGYKRAYIHHLLQTHEMSAHALLAMHNLTVMDTFMRGIRVVLQRGAEEFVAEVARFEAAYDGRMRLLDEARERWREVDLVRGKGRLARERARKSAEEVDPGELEE